MDQSLDPLAKLDQEVELLIASLLPFETLTSSPPDTFPRTLDVTSRESKFGLHVEVDKVYPARDSVRVEVKGWDIGRDEAEGWKEWVTEKLREWDASLETPMYNVMTAHFLPLLAPTAPASPPVTTAQRRLSIAAQTPYHALITTHHLVSVQKRRNLIDMAHDFNLVGFSKYGNPGIVYAVGERDKLIDWLAEVKSWNWLALKVKISVEPVPSHQVQPIEKEVLFGPGGEGAEKDRGEWVECEKIVDCLEWMKKKCRANVLVDAGIGMQRKSSISFL